MQVHLDRGRSALGEDGAHRWTATVETSDGECRPIRVTVPDKVISLLRRGSIFDAGESGEEDSIERAAASAVWDRHWISEVVLVASDFH